MAQLNMMELLSRQLNLLISGMERLQRFLASAPIPNTSFPELSAGGQQGKLRPGLWRLICPQKLIRRVHLSVLFPCLSPPTPVPSPPPSRLSEEASADNIYADNISRVEKDLDSPGCPLIP